MSEELTLNQTIDDVFDKHGANKFGTSDNYVSHMKGDDRVDFLSLNLGLNGALLEDDLDVCGSTYINEQAELFESSHMAKDCLGISLDRQVLYDSAAVETTTLTKDSLGMPLERPVVCKTLLAEKSSLKNESTLDDLPCDLLHQDSIVSDCTDQTPDVANSKREADKSVIHIDRDLIQSVFMAHNKEPAGQSTNKFSLQDALIIIPILPTGLVASTLNDNKLTKVVKKASSFPCGFPGCEKVFKKSGKRRIHHMTHVGDRPFVCSVAGCDWTFTTAYKLKRHEESHTGVKKYLCKYTNCGGKFTTIYNLRTHVKRVHEAQGREVCTEEMCGEKFTSKRRLDLHMRQHTGNKKLYKCPLASCKKTFYSSVCMGSHVRVHQRELMCRFDGCGRVFDKPCRLKQHMRQHTGEKPYMCTVQDCKSAFSTASKLKRHERKHTNERKFVCVHCGKAFMRADHLNGHVISHTGTRPFKCTVEGCDAKFSAKSSVYVHQKKHQLNGQSVRCPMEGCRRHFVSKDSFKQHITAEHCEDGLSYFHTPDLDSLVSFLNGDDLDSTHSEFQEMVEKSEQERQRFIKDKLDIRLPEFEDDLKSPDDALGGLSLSPVEMTTSQAITFRDPETGAVYLQTQLLQDDPPGPYTDAALTKDMEDEELLEKSLAEVADVVFMGSTINLQDLA